MELLLLTAVVRAMLAVTFGVMIGAAAPAHRVERTAVDWQPNLTTALAVASRTQRTVIADFYTDWCVECHQMDRVTFADSAFAARTRRYVWVKVNAEKDTLAARRYGVQGYPTIVVMRPDGREYDRVLGLTPPARFEAEVADYEAGRNTLEALLRDEPQHLNDWEFVSRLAEKLTGHGRVAEGLERYRRIWKGTEGMTTETVQKTGFWLARVALREHRGEDALAYCQEWEQRFPGSPFTGHVQLLKGQVYQSLERHEDARATFEAWLKAYPDAPDADEVRAVLAQTAAKPPRH